ncbi:MAG: trypsin-like peptidase domain-containing protein [Lachnospiraceae bacterium]|nr:trypsin-like peptidase domain-containing protein [Lachnospiraceae bacterium]
MYDNNDNYSQQSNNSGNTGNGYPEYYYSANTPNANYNQTINAAPIPPTGKSRKKGSFGKKAVSVVCLGLVFGVTAGAAFSIPATLATRELRETKLEIQQMQEAMNAEAAAGKTALSKTSDSLTASNALYNNNSTTNISVIANSCLPSVVSITNKGVTEVRTMFGTYQRDTESSGSGIIIGENDTELLIVTNYHVVSGSSELSVVFSYDEDSDKPSLVSARVKGYEADKDLAVIAVSLDDITDEMRSKIKIATIGDSSNLVLGQEVVAIGNALGYGQSVTTGIISALGRDVTVSDENGGRITNKLIQTDAAINPGNSGGALLNMNGELIGINSVKVASSSVEGMGYAIPISDVQSIIEELMLKETRDVVAEEQRGYLGINPIDVTNDIYETYGMPVGVYINIVYEDSPAEAAGLVKGNIITKFDGQTVKTREQLVSLMSYYSIGESVDIVAMVQSSNGYVEKTFHVTLGSKDIFGEDSDNVQSTPKQQEPEDDIDDFFSNPFGSFWSFP